MLAGAAEDPGGEVEGEPYPSLSETRAGGIGGTAALWDAELARGSMGARYAPLARIDFEQRDAVPMSGWPFSRETLDPFYARAQELCDAGPYDYEASGAEATNGPVPLRSDVVASGLFRFGPSDSFTRAQRDGLARSDTVRVLTPATATRILTAADGRAVQEVEASSAPGRSFCVQAGVYVLAAGGIENARLLLLSDIGNDHGLVGRCFMDHPTIRCRLELEPKSGWGLGFYDIRTVANRLVLGRLELREETLRAEGLLNGTFFVAPARDRELRAAAATRSIVQAARARRIPAEPARRAGELVAGLDALGFAAHRRLAGAFPLLEPSLRLWPRSRLLDTLGLGPVSGWSGLRARPRVFDVHHVVEQAPDPERQITLGAGLDRFGSRVARLRWFLGAREAASADRSEELLREELQRLGVGRLRTARELAPDGDLAAVVHPSAHHHLGTTRMHRDAHYGVVDPDGRVHALANLFVTGGSVFPTSGYVNPTLTIVALALRLGAHLRQDVSR